MNKIYILILCFLGLTQASSADYWDFLPGEPLFAPLIGDLQEPQYSIVARPDPDLDLATTPSTGQVVVWTTYSVPPERASEFLHAMHRVRESRFRTGATQWGLFRSGEQPGEFEEIFFVASWEEHLRQHRERLTATDRGFEDEAKALATSPPLTRHLLATDFDDR